MSFLVNVGDWVLVFCVELYEVLGIWIVSYMKRWFNCYIKDGGWGNKENSSIYFYFEN